MILWLRRALSCLPAALLGCVFVLPVKADDNDHANTLYLEALRAISENRYEDAKTMLTSLIEQLPNHGGALLDLATMQCGLGNKTEAESLFRRLKERFPLSEEQIKTIDQLQEQSCAVKSLPLQISVALERGYDTNVNQGASNPNFSLGSGATQIDLQLLPEYQPRADRFSTITVSAAKEFDANKLTGFTQFRVRNYDDLAAFNTVAIAAGIERPWRIGDVGIRSTGMIGLLTLGNRLYQKQEIVQFRIPPSIQRNQRLQLSLIAGLANVQYPTLTNYDAHTWELRSLLSYDADKWHLQGGVAYLADRAHTDRQGGNREGYYANINARGLIYKQYEAEIGWSRQLWQSAQVYSPGLIDVARRQNTQTLKAGISWPVSDRQTLQLEYRMTNNKENIPILQYSSRLLQLSWQWQNF